MLQFRLPDDGVRVAIATPLGRRLLRFVLQRHNEALLPRQGENHSYRHKKPLMHAMGGFRALAAT